MEHCESIPGMIERARGWQRQHASIGLVPTMGALHEGHISLARAARAECDRVVATIFVNPLQFGANEDLDRYPRTLDADLAMLRDAGCDAVFTTTPAEMYPAPYSTYVVEDDLSTRLEGAVRENHFRGVLTVVAKLFHVCRPDRAYFGQKDAQQARLIRRMVDDLNFPLEVRVMPIVREPDGLAMSSRNRYLSEDGRRRATALHRALQAAIAEHRRGERDAETLKASARRVLDEDELDVDYVALVDRESLRDLDRCDAGLMLIAARVDQTRLIDNAFLPAGDFP